MKLPIVQAMLLTSLMCTPERSSCVVSGQDRKFFYYEDEHHNTSKEWVRYFIAYSLLFDMLEDDSQLDPRTTKSISDVLPKTSLLRKACNRFKTPKKVTVSLYSPPTTHTQRSRANESSPRTPPNCISDSRPRQHPINLVNPTDRGCEHPKHRNGNLRSKSALKDNAKYYFKLARTEARCYEQRKACFNKCIKSCYLLKSNSDISVCFCFLGDLAFEKMYYSKATRFYHNACKTYGIANIFKKYQCSLSCIRAKLSRATNDKRSRQKVACSNQIHHQDLVENNQQGTTATPDSNYCSCIDWSQSVSSVDTPNPQTEQLVTGSFNERDRHNCSEYSCPQQCQTTIITIVYYSFSDTEELPAVVKPMVGMCGDD